MPRPITADIADRMKRRITPDPSSPSGLAWARRDPTDFNTQDPDKTAALFNTKTAGKPVPLTRSGQHVRFNQKSYPLTAVCALVGVAPPARPVRPPRPRVPVALPKRHTDSRPFRLSPGVIQMLFEIDPATGFIAWRTRTRDMLPVLSAHLPDPESREPWSDHGMQIFNATFAGNPVAITKAGTIALMRRHMWVEHVLAALGGAPYVPPPEPPRREIVRQPVPDSVLLALLTRRHGMLVWKPREAKEWGMLAIMGYIDAIPDDAEQADWNDVHAGKEAWTISPRRIYVQIGNKRVTPSRINRVVPM